MSAAAGPVTQDRRPFWLFLRRVIHPFRNIGPSSLAIVNVLWRKTALRWVLLFFPTLLAAGYLFFIAADQFESEAHFVVRSAARPEMPGGLSFLIQLGLTRSQDDSFIVQDFMTSRDAVGQLRAKLPLQTMFKRKGADFLASYPSIIYGPEDEEFYRYFQRMASVIHMDKSGISTLRVKAFQPGDARAIALTLLELAEGLINRINERLQTDAVGNSLAELQTAQRRLINAQTALTDFRNRELLVDPSQNAVALAELIAGLSAELGMVQAQLAEVRSGTSASPQLPGLQRKAAALREQIANERARISGDSGGLATRIQSYERLSIEREFASRMLASAEADLLRARAEAARQLLYLERIVEPNLSDHSTAPQKIRGFLTVLAVNILAVLIGWLFISGVKDHAQ